MKAIRSACRLVLYALIGVGAASSATAAPAHSLVLWYDKPAARWEEAIPLGNGRLGAMVFGGITNEHLQLNEDTLVSGEPGWRDIPMDVRKDFAHVTNLLAQRKFADADRFVTEKWLGRAQACYQPLGDLYLEFPNLGAVSQYRRELNLETSLCRISYQADGGAYTRDIFASHPDQIIAIRLTAPKGKLNFRARLTSPHPTATKAAQGAELRLTGQLPGFVLRRTLEQVEKKGETWKYPEIFDKDGKRLPHASTVLYGKDIQGKGIRFAAHLAVGLQGGKVAADNGALEISGADEALLIFSAASSFNGFQKSPTKEGVDEIAKAAGFLKAAGARAFNELRERHTRDYAALFGRVSLDLGADAAQSALPTDQRVKQFGNGQDPSLAAVYFQFARYLMISGSRPGTQPLTLQGIWNPHIIPPWASQYTININTEMNYWPAEMANLSECHEPLLRMVKELAVDGAKVAREVYHARGWVAHHNTTLWRDAQAVDGAAQASFWPMVGGWFCQHLYDHYQFTGDKEFLRRDAYPLMKGACEFYLDWLVPDAQGRLLTPVSTSPENNFNYQDESGRRQRASVSPGCTMDMAIIRDVFQNTLAAAQTLNTDAAFQATLKSALAKLLPYQIGARGQLQEWSEDFTDAEPAHRHVSHLYALHPGRDINVRATPALAAAAKRTLELRGDGGTGWSKAWKVNFWARLEDGDHAYKMLSELIAKSTLPNMFDTHPPFQIDGNFGGASGMIEMLLQTQTAELHLLPALPSAWPAGTVKGLCARGGFEVDLAWRDGKLTQAVIRSKLGNPCKLRLGDKVMTLPTQAGKSYTLDGRLTPPAS